MLRVQYHGMAMCNLTPAKNIIGAFANVAMLPRMLCRAGSINEGSQSKSPRNTMPSQKFHFNDST